jgi:hypothetical protein
MGLLCIEIAMCRQLSLLEVIMMQLIPNFEQLSMLYNCAVILSILGNQVTLPSVSSILTSSSPRPSLIECRWHANTIVVIGGFHLLLITYASIAVEGISFVCTRTQVTTNS